jgi:uncharacterized membrane protein YfcA
MTWYAAVGVLALGFASGVLSGMFGVGGAVITTPGIRALGATPIEAIGSTVPAILPGAISGTVRYSRAGVVNWRIGLTCGITGALMAVAGATVSDVVSAGGLMVFTAVLLAWSGVSIFRSGRRSSVAAGTATATSPVVVDAEEEVAAVRADQPSTPTHTDVAWPVLALVGALAGFLAGLLGVGGGIVMMPAFTSVLRIPIKEAVASSLVAVAIFSVPALLTHIVLDHVNWTFALLLTVGVIPGAQVGSTLTLGATDRTVRVLFGAFLVVVAGVYGTIELLALVSAS